MFCYLEGYPMMILGNYHAVLRELLLTKNTRRWTTEITQRDGLFLDRLGVDHE